MLRSKLSLSVSAALLLGMASITGCGVNDAANNTVETKNVRGADNGRIGTNAVNGGLRANAFDKMHMSNALADRVEQLPDVRSANVLVAGNRAYVAVTLDEAAGGTHAQGGTGNMGRLNTYGTGNGATGMINGTGTAAGGLGTSMGAPGNGLGTGMYGTRTGMGGTGTGTGGTGTGFGVNGMGGADTGMGGTGFGMGGTRGTVTGTPGMTGTGGSINGIPGNMTGTGTTGGTGTANPREYAGNGNNGILSNLTDGRQMSRDIDNGMGRGRGIGIRSTTPGGTNGMTRDDSVTTDMKNKIATEIKKYTPTIQEVYVSANPDFVERTNFFADEVRAGHPLKGFANEFRTMAERIFPTRSGY